jgi:multiple sugar transport system ATP-binding protein
MGRALARDPKLFLFDEPLSNLDAKLRVEMRAEIKLLHQRTHTTTVYVTHDQVEAMTLGDRIAVMKDGRVQQFGTPDDIYSRPATTFVAEFIGSPAMNMIRAARQGEALVAHGLALPLTELQRASLGQAGAEIVCGLRPEDITLQPEAAGAIVQGQVIITEPTGPETYVSLDTPLGKLTSRVAGRAPHRVGDRLGLAWLPRATHLFDAKTGERLPG